MSRKVVHVPGGIPRLWILILPCCSTTKRRPVSPGGEATNSGPVSPETTVTLDSVVLAEVETPVHANWANAETRAARIEHTAALEASWTNRLMFGISCEPTPAEWVYSGPGTTAT